MKIYKKGSGLYFFDFLFDIYSPITKGRRYLALFTHTTHSKLKKPPNGGFFLAPLLGLPDIVASSGQANQGPIPIRPYRDQPL